jgi:hypothetical protein
MNNSEQQKKGNTQVYAENISIYYGRCHFIYFNLVDFQCKQFIVCKFEIDIKESLIIFKHIIQVFPP